MPLWMLFGSAAFAYESDQLTERFTPLADAAPLADARANDLLAQAVEASNRDTRCAEDLEGMRRSLAREIHRAMGGAVRIPARDGQPGMKFGAYAAWLETAPIERLSFPRRQHIYADVSWWHSVILGAVGPSSTVDLAGVRVGTDKIDHFWVQGYLYWRQSDWGRSEQKALRWGTHTERAYWGLATTDVFSFADLAANHRGYGLYAGLLLPGSIFALDGEGCVVQGRPFHWSEWIDWQFDEVQNPSAYEPGVLADLRAWLIAHRGEVCDGLDEATARDLAARVDAAVREAYPYVEGRAPERVDPFELHYLCFGEVSP